MGEPIRVDLEAAQQCDADRMIKFLFTFCLSKDGKTLPVCDMKALEHAFKKVKKIAERPGTPLETQFLKL
jgi:hypothetical protein